jgi:hypothetical protein
MFDCLGSWLLPGSESRNAVSISAYLLWHAGHSLHHVRLVQKEKAHLTNAATISEVHTQIEFMHDAGGKLQYLKHATKSLVHETHTSLKTMIRKVRTEPNLES